MASAVTVEMTLAMLTAMDRAIRKDISMGKGQRKMETSMVTMAMDRDQRKMDITMVTMQIKERDQRKMDISMVTMAMERDHRKIDNAMVTMALTRMWEMLPAKERDQRTIWRKSKTNVKVI